MAETKQLQCPTCGAGLTIPIGALRAKCGYCGTELTVESSQGELFLRGTEQIASALREDREVTHSALKRLELGQRRVQLAQDLSFVTRDLQPIREMYVRGAACGR